jgi:lipoprotein signal peptidase
MHYYITHLTSRTVGSGFISIYITYNSGVAFSFGESLGAGGIYALQILVSLVIFGVICFTRK